MNSFAKLTKYMQNAVDTVFAAESKTAILENGTKFIDLNFKETGYVKILDILMDGLSDYHRVNNGNSQSGFTSVPTQEGFKVGNATSKWVIYQLTQLRGKQFQIDYLDDEEQAGMIMGNLLTEFLRTRVVPEIDAYRFSTIVGHTHATLGNIVSGAIDANTIISKFNNGYQWLAENEVPEEDQVIFVNPAVMTLIRNTTELAKRLVVEASPKAVDLRISKYEGRDIIEVPSGRFFTDISINDNGFSPKVGSKVINFIICSKRCVVPIMKLEYSKIWSPEQVQEFHGYKINTLFYHDLIVPKNKLLGIYASVGTANATTVNSVLRLAISLASAGNYYIEGVYTAPAGILGRLVAKSTAFVLGATVSNPVVLATGNDPKTAVAISGEKSFFALIDQDNKVVAVSAEVTLPTA